MGLFAAAIGVFLFFCLFFVTMRIFELELPANINIYLGSGAAVVSVLLYIFLFIVPLVKILKLNYFITNVNAKTARAAQRHNRQVRHGLADKIIDLTAKVEGVGWYDSEVVGRLAIAQKTGDEKALSGCLSELYSGCVKKNAKDMILKTSLKTGMYSAISQTNHVDALLVAFLNLQLVKDIVFLYGFRPSDTRLVRIFGRVLQNSLIASSVQGLTNSVLTAVIGHQTIKYLSTEYRLQEILDGIEIEETEEEFTQTCSEIEKQLKAGKLQKAS